MIGLSLFYECNFVDGTASERTGVYSADLVHLYADYAPLLLLICTMLLPFFGL